MGVANNPSDNCFHVFYHPEGTDLDPNSILDGFTITGGNAENSSPYFGGGMYNRANNHPTLIKCTFAHNLAEFGGGMFNYNDSSPTVSHSAFISNSVIAGGGGMLNYRNSPEVKGGKFISNLAQFKGGGMYNGSSNPSIINCVFSGNSADYDGNCGPPQCDGGGIYNNESNSTILNCSFALNVASYGGSMHNYNCFPTITNCIYWGNTVTTGYGNEIYNYSSLPIISYCDIASCGGSGAGWDTALGTDEGGNINADPMFKDADGPDNIPGTEDDNLQLTYNSPCIDAGDNTVVPVDTTDLDNDGDTTERIPLDLAGNDRFIDDPQTLDTGVADPPDYPNVVDMGAYERYEFCGGNVSQALKGDLNLDCYIDLLDFGIMARYWLQYIGPD
jgi:hypothetical protein